MNQSLLCAIYGIPARVLRDRQRPIQTLRSPEERRAQARRASRRAHRECRVRALAARLSAGM